MRAAFGSSTAAVVCAWALALASTPNPASAGAASARVVEGIDRAVVELPVEARVDSYENAGYRVRRVGGAYEVEVTILPLASAAPYVAPEGAGSDPIERLSRQLARGSRDQYEAASRILGWIARNVRYALDRGASQEAADVLARGSGYCTGVARLAVSLLRGAGLEAREVPGFVVGGADSGFDATESVTGYHRWIEVHFPDRGWVFSDPLLFHHFVPASYVPLASEELDLGEGEPVGSGRVLRRERRVEIADVHVLAPPRVLARRNRPRQIASTVRVVVEPPQRAIGTLELTGDGRVWRQPLVDGEGTFVGLEAGDYELRVETAAGPTLERRLRLAAAIRSVLTVSLENRAPAAPPPASRR